MRRLLSKILALATFVSSLSLLPVVLETDVAHAALLNTLRFPREKVASIFDAQGRRPMQCLENSGTCGGIKTANGEETLASGGYFKIESYPTPTYTAFLRKCDANNSCRDLFLGNVYAYKPGHYFLFRSSDFPAKLLIFSLGSANPYSLANGTTISWTFDSATLGEGIYNSTPTNTAVSVTGTFRSGSTLTGIETYSGVDVEFERQWKRFNTYMPLYNVSGSDIAGATSNSYTLTDADVGKYIRYTVKFKNMHGYGSRSQPFGIFTDYQLVLPALQPALNPTFGSYTATATGFTVVITNYDTAYTWSGTATNGGSVSFSGTNGNGLATITGIAPNTASVATITTTRENYVSGSSSTNATTSLRSGLTPTFGSYTRTADGFYVTITNYDANYTWRGSATNGGRVSIEPGVGGGFAIIEGLSPNTASVATITTTRSGYAQGSANTSSTNSLAAALVPAFTNYRQTNDGYTVEISNYSGDYMWSGSANNAAQVAIDKELVTVSGLSPGSAAVATISTTRTGFSPGSAATTSTSALVPGLTPTFGVYTRTSDGFTVVITNYDTAYSWSGTSTSGGTVSFSGTRNNGLATVRGLAAQTAAVATITASRTGYRTAAAATASTTSLSAPLLPALTSGSVTPGGFTFQITNYDPAFTYDISTSAGRVTRGTPNGNRAPITVSGLARGVSATVTITTSRTGFASTSISRTQTARAADITLTTGNPAPWNSAAISSDGSYLVAAANNTRLFVSPNNGVDWYATSVVRPWNSVAISGSGEKMLAAASKAKLSLSRNYGVTWQSVGAEQDWRAVAVSEDGSLLYGAVANGFIYKSGDNGANWTQIGSSKNWRAIATSSNGATVLAATYGGTLSVSTDSGATWSERDSARNWSAVSISDDGSVMTATVAGGGVYLSIDSGTSWNAIAGLARKNWNSISCNSTCSRFAVSNVSGNLFLMSDQGEVMVDATGASKWTAVVMDATGRQTVAMAISGSMRYTMTWGVTWSPLNRISL